jgi:hypothetical protein
MSNVKVGQRVWLQSSTNRWLCGIIKSIDSEEIVLEQSSWIDHTGDFWGNALQTGADAVGTDGKRWSSEYQGETTILRGDNPIEILQMGPNAILPGTHVRPRSDRAAGKSSENTETVKN